MPGSGLPSLDDPNMNFEQTVILDVFGTLATIERPHKAYSLLREALGVSDTRAFGRLAMTESLTLAGLAGRTGRIDPQVLAGIERLLWDETASVRLFPETISVLSELLAQGTRVVLGSNLAMPFGCALEPLLDAVGPWSRLGEDPDAQAITAFSYDIGHLKPEAEFYRHIQKALGAPTRSLAMTGDRLDEDCQAPARQGWRSHQLQREEGQTLIDAVMALDLLR